MARFVGADRGLKRLALVRIGSLDLQPAPTVAIGSDAGEARARARDDRVQYLLVVDERGRPLEWLRADAVPASGPIRATEDMPADPVFDRHTTLKDALSMLLASGVQTGVAVDDRGVVLGLVTTDMIGERTRTPTAAGQ